MKPTNKRVFSEIYKGKQIEVIRKLLDFSNSIDGAKFVYVYYGYVNKQLIGFWEEEEKIAIGFTKGYVAGKEVGYNEAREDVREALGLPSCSECERY